MQVTTGTAGITAKLPTRKRDLWPVCRCNIRHSPCHQQRAHPGPWPTPLMTSGARYSSVPTKEFALASGTAIRVISCDGLILPSCAPQAKLLDMLHSPSPTVGPARRFHIEDLSHCLYSAGASKRWCSKTLPQVGDNRLFVVQQQSRVGGVPLRLSTISSRYSTR